MPGSDNRTIINVDTDIFGMSSTSAGVYHMRVHVSYYSCEGASAPPDCCIAKGKWTRQYINLSYGVKWDGKWEQYR